MKDTGKKCLCEGGGGKCRSEAETTISIRVINAILTLKMEGQTVEGWRTGGGLVNEAPPHLYPCRVEHLYSS